MKFMKNALKVTMSAAICGALLAGASHAETPVDAVKKAAETKVTTGAKKQVMKGTGSRSLARFKKVDKDGNQKISKSEFQAAYDVTFARKDKNKDGMLDKGEFSPTLGKLAR